MNTILRIIGQPDDLRLELFSMSLDVTVAAALPEPGRVFGGLSAVQGWKAAGPPNGGPAGYILTVSDVAKAAPAVTRALVAAGADVLSIGQSRHTLEDVYLERPQLFRRGQVHPEQVSHSWPSGTGVTPVIHAADATPGSTSPDDDVGSWADAGCGAGTKSPLGDLVSPFTPLTSQPVNPVTHPS
jgi:hypothetical protein